jgi:hypothetical protein
LFYGVKPDYHTLFQWGCLGYYCHVRDLSGGRGQFNMHSSVGMVIGRSNHTDGMIFWDPVTQRMNVSADYKLDPSAPHWHSLPHRDIRWPDQSSGSLWGEAFYQRTFSTRIRCPS